MSGMTGGAQPATEFLAVALEIAELRQQLAEVQNQCIELTVDAGELHAEIEILQGQLLTSERACDRWRFLAEQRLAGLDSISQPWPGSRCALSTRKRQGFHPAATLRLDRPNIKGR